MPPPRDPIGIPQQVGTWEGSGDHTIGFVSNSGKFRIRWAAHPEPGQAEGVFHLTVHSAVSGRPLQEVVDQRGAGEGVFNFEDDPRQYNLMVTSSGLRWSIVVDEVVLVTPTSEAQTSGTPDSIRSRWARSAPRAATNRR